MKTVLRIEYFPVGSPEFNAVEECWRQGKYNVLSNYYSSFSHLKQVISQYYRTRTIQSRYQKVSAEIYELMLLSIDIIKPLNCKASK